MNYPYSALYLEKNTSLRLNQIKKYLFSLKLSEPIKLFYSYIIFTFVFQATNKHKTKRRLFIRFKSLNQKLVQNTDVLTKIHKRGKVATKKITLVKPLYKRETP